MIATIEDALVFASVATCLTLAAVRCAAGYGRTLSMRKLFGLLCLAGGGVVFASLAGRHGATITAACLVAVCAIATWTDLETGLVFDRVLALAAIPLVVEACIRSRCPDAALGALLASAPIALPFLWTRGRGMGLGDVKLSALIGFALGSSGALIAIWCASIAGGVFAVSALLLGAANRKSEVRFAGFLALGACCALGAVR